MSESPHLGLGYLAPNQAQKHVTVNEALRRLDALVQLGVVDRIRTTPPASPAEGDRHIVALGATGAWDGQGGKLAAFLDGRWVFVRPKPGWIAYDAAAGELVAFVGDAWITAASLLVSLDNVARVGIATSADSVNRLAVASEAALFTHAGAGVQVKLNKASAVETASLLFQTAYSGRAECGLAGSDGFSLKVSADGAAWRTALIADAATGAVELPNTPTVQVDKFVSSGIWTKPAWAKRVRVVLVGGGSGGGSGGLRGPGAAVSGGGGGAPGGVCEMEFVAADLTATVSVTVGAGGAGGALRPPRTQTASQASSAALRPSAAISWLEARRSPPAEERRRLARSESSGATASIPRPSTCRLGRAPWPRAGPAAPGRAVSPAAAAAAAVCRRRTPRRAAALRAALPC